MRTLAILATATTLMNSPVMAASGKLYRCTPKDLVTFQNDGRFGTFPTTFWQDQWTDVLIDTATGLIRWKDGTSQYWVVARKGNDVNDHVLAGTGAAVFDTASAAHWTHSLYGDDIHINDQGQAVYAAVFECLVKTLRTTDDTAACRSAGAQP